MFRKRLRNTLYENNEDHRNHWIKKELLALPPGTNFWTQEPGSNCGDYFTYFEQEFARLGSVVKRCTEKKAFLVRMLSLLLLPKLDKISRGSFL